MLQKRAATFVHHHPSRSYSSIFKQNFSNSSNLEPHKTSKFLIYCNTQIAINGRDGNLKEAESIFNRMPHKSTVSWTAMLTAYSQNGQIAKARNLFDEIPDRTTASYNAMITAYVKNGSDVEEAYELFARMPVRNGVSYATMITGFVRRGMLDKAEEFYADIPDEWRDPVCSNALISGYLKLGRLEEAVRVFKDMVETDLVSWSSMVDGYCKKGRVLEARGLFDMMPERNVITWTAMIDGYMKVGCFENGFGLFSSMRRGVVKVNSNTLTVMFEACGNFCRYREGVQIHGLVSRMGFNFDIFLGNSIITMYFRIGFVDEANKIFWMMNKKDLVSWNSLISGYVQNDEIEEAYRLFQIMPVKDLVSWTTMIAGFSNKGNIEKSVQLFRMMPEKDDFSWTAIISGFVNNELYEEAFRWFIGMLQKEIRPNQLTLSSVLSASAGLATLNQGAQVHALVLKMGMEFDLYIQSSLVSMYSKCGYVAEAYWIFTNISAPNIVSFNSMITGFAQNGFGEEALNLFRRMKNEGREPNCITFLGVLSACTHVGLVQEGLEYFKSMKSSYGIQPEPDHYASMIDLLGRAGLLDEAIDMIRSMPFKPHAGVWGALLGASRNHLHLDFAKLAAQHLIEWEPDNASPYVILSNLYSIVGKKMDADQVRMTKKLKGVRKSPGCSWITVKDKVHLFLAGEQSHMDLNKIRFTLSTISKEMKGLSRHREDWLSFDQSSDIS
ncbi:hypothetical protein LWI28_006141 [Acer negundo]|uniref:Chlororespiratory reduction 4 n=1 Tax=Acer negundo TaxID=4023 RepID=A0AAD5J4R6_ACENE|nr:hypothetical protein LWI28_006141 [Acer negundo]